MLTATRIATCASLGLATALLARYLAQGEWMLEPWRKSFLETARRELENGTLYQWGGGRNPATDWGVDCSGLFVMAMREAGIKPPPEGQTANVFYHALPKVTDPKPGDLAFFGPDASKAVHVVMVEKALPDGDAVTIGANGGDSDVTSPAVAQARGAHVSRKLVSEFKFNPFLGYATLDPEARGLASEGVREGAPFVACCGLCRTSICMRRPAKNCARCFVTPSVT